MSSLADAADILVEDFGRSDRHHLLRVDGDPGTAALSCHVARLA